MGSAGFAFQEELPGNTDFCLLLYIHKPVIDNNKHYPKKAITAIIVSV